MASRQEEKERRRIERMAAEDAAASAQTRNRRIQMALAAVLAVGVIIGIVVAVAGSGGGGGGSADGPKAKNTSGASIPPARNKDLASAAKAAGCVLMSPRIEGRDHVTTPVTYHTNPPSSGPHNPTPALDGIYDPGNAPSPEHYVHALEHGRVEVQYKPGTPANRISQLETLVSEPLNGKAAYKVLLFENNTKMPYAVAATAWGQILGCKTFTDQAFDAIRDFRITYVDKGPELGIPPNN